MDTTAKKTLWFHLIPLLDEDDQEHCKRRLCSPFFDRRNSRYSHLINSSVSSSGLSAVDRDTIKKYYYKHDEKYGYDDDFVLTDREIDNLFDLTSHLPENHGNYKVYGSNIAQCLNFVLRSL